LKNLQKIHYELIDFSIITCYNQYRKYDLESEKCLMSV